MKIGGSVFLVQETNFSLHTANTSSTDYILYLGSKYLLSVSPRSSVKPLVDTEPSNFVLTIKYQWLLTNFYNLVLFRNPIVMERFVMLWLLEGRFRTSKHLCVNGVIFYYFWPQHSLLKVTTVVLNYVPRIKM